VSNAYLKPKKVANIFVFPGLFGRLKRLFGGFDYIPFLLAQVYGTFGLLPRSHPYLSDKNIGRYGIVKLISAAANHTPFDRDHIDKVILFGASIASIVIIFLFVVATLIYTVATPVWASNIFITPNPTTDMAFDLLDQVIGVPGLYDPTYTTVTPFQSGIHAMLRLYSSALFVFAMIYFLYYIFSLVAETAITGTPFGKRFHKIWAPIRFVLAIGLLVPFGAHGLNSAQYIILYTAKLGSGMATNTWIAFNSTLSQPFGTGAAYTGEFSRQYYTTQDGDIQAWDPGPFQSQGLVAIPEMPDIKRLAAAINLIHTCILGYEVYHGKEIEPYLVKSDPNMMLDLSSGNIPYTDALDFTEGNDMVIKFGEYNEQEHQEEPGYVFPYCGSITVPALQSDFMNISEIRELFYDLIARGAFSPSSPDIYLPARFYAERMIGLYAQGTETPIDDCRSDTNGNDFPDAGYTGEYTAIGVCDYKPNLMHKSFYASELQRHFDMRAYPEMRALLRADRLFEMPVEIEELGWAGAGIWYNRITEMNGDVFQALQAVPFSGEPPVLMADVIKDRTMLNQITPAGEFALRVQGRGVVNFNNAKDREFASVMTRAYQDWQTERDAQESQVDAGHHPFVRAIAFVFGATPILTIRENSGVHPFAKLAAIGKGLIENSIKALMYAMALSAGAGFFEVGGAGVGALFQGGSGFFIAIATAAMTSGFLLHYIVPFMPFLYFFFAVGGWIKTMFEALVGAPLWALAHMQLEGDSLVPKQAQSGYFLALEVFVRPMLILFGLLASSTIFAAQAAVLNSIFDLVTANLSGFGPSTGRTGMMDIEYYRRIVDQAFFTVMYVIIIYLMATSSFKLVDSIPNNLLRWISGGVKSFGDMAKDPAEQLTTYATIGAGKFGRPIAQGVGSAGSVVGGMAGEAVGQKNVLGMASAMNSNMGKIIAGTGLTAMVADMIPSEVSAAEDIEGVEIIDPNEGEVPAEDGASSPDTETDGDTVGLVPGTEDTVTDAQSGDITAGDEETGQGNITDDSTSASSDTPPKSPSEGDE